LGGRANPAESKKILWLRRQQEKAEKKYEKAWVQRQKFTFDDFMDGRPGADAAERRYRGALKGTERARNALASALEAESKARGGPYW
jgi:hypothetical protein